MASNRCLSFEALIGVFRACQINIYTTIWTLKQKLCSWDFLKFRNIVRLYTFGTRASFGGACTTSPNLISSCFGKFSLSVSSVFPWLFFCFLASQYLHQSITSSNSNKTYTKWPLLNLLLLAFFPFRPTIQLRKLLFETKVFYLIPLSFSL